jgi:hypothetical protein
MCPITPRGGCRVKQTCRRKLQTCLPAGRSQAPNGKQVPNHKHQTANKFQITSTKTQTRTKYQIPNSKRRNGFQIPNEETDLLVDCGLLLFLVWNLLFCLLVLV